jgi:hypothetical protein
MSVIQKERDTARVRAEACAEHALMELRRTLDYAGDERILVGDGSCDILTILGEGNKNRTIEVQSGTDELMYRMRVVAETTSPDVTITSFERVPSF